MNLSRETVAFDPGLALGALLAGNLGAPEEAGVLRGWEARVHRL